MIKKIVIFSAFVISSMGQFVAAQAIPQAVSYRNNLDCEKQTHGENTPLNRTLIYRYSAGTAGSIRILDGNKRQIHAGSTDADNPSANSYYKGCYAISLAQVGMPRAMAYATIFYCGAELKPYIQIVDPTNLNAARENVFECRVVR